MGIGTHHRHVRKRIYKHLQQYPHPDRLVRLLDHVVYVAGFVGPVMTLPQIYTVFVLGQTSGVAVATWATYAILDIPWIVYGLVHREQVIVFTYTLWGIANSLVVVGVLLHR